MAFNTAVIRELLSSGFNDEELRTLSYDHFRPVYEEFTTGMTKGEMIQLLLDYAGRRDEISEPAGYCPAGESLPLCPLRRSLERDRSRPPLPPNT